MACAIKLDEPRFYYGCNITHYKICATKIEHQRKSLGVVGAIYVWIMPGWYENGTIVEPVDTFPGYPPIVLQGDLFEEFCSINTSGNNLLHEYENNIAIFLIERGLIPNGTVEQC
jgi:hypothetical protein